MDPFLGDIKIFAGSFAPVNWLFCDGSVLNIAQYNALYALIGTTYGGNGSTTFAVPDLRGRLPIGQGTGPGLTQKPMGAKGGTETAGLVLPETPAHTHLIKASMSTTASVVVPTPDTYLGPLVVEGQTGLGYVSNVSAGTKKVLDDSVIHPFIGGGQPHINMMPSKAINFIICTAGIFPTRD